MPAITYFIRFVHRNPSSSTPFEEREYTRLTDAWESFRLFAEPDSMEIYSQIELAGHNWETGEDFPIASMEFSNPDFF